MARFTKALGMPPMTVLKGLRMRQAASMLTTELSVDQIARSVGYTSRSSFLRALHNTYGKYPSDYRAQRRAEIAPKTEMKIIMNDKLSLKNTMLNLEAEKLAYAEQAYVDYLHGSAPDYSEARDHGEFSLRFNEAEIALAFECPLHNYEDAIATIRTIDFGPKTEVEPGAVIQLEGQWFVVGTATAPFTCQGITYLGISTQAPIYQCLEGKRAGETCQWNDKDLQLNVVS